MGRTRKPPEPGGSSPSYWERSQPILRNIGNHFHRNYQLYITSLIAVIGLYLMRWKHPGLEMDIRSVVELMPTTENSDSDLSVTYKGRVLQRPTEVLATLTNTGNTAIRRSDVSLHPYFRIVGNAIVRTRIDQKVPDRQLSVSHEGNKVTVQVDGIFNPGDSVSIKILCDHEPLYFTAMKAVVADMRAPITRYSPCGPASSRLLFLESNWLVEILVFVVATVGFLYSLAEFIRRVFSKPIKQRPAFSILLLMVVFLSLVCIVLVGGGAWRDLINGYSSERYMIMEHIPEIRTETNMDSAIESSVIPMAIPMAPSRPKPDEEPAKEAEPLPAPTPFKGLGFFGDDSICDPRTRRIQVK